MSETIPSPIMQFPDYQAALQSSVDSVVVASSSLPDDLSFHRSLDRQFGKRLDSHSDRILSLTSRLLDFIDAGNRINARQGGGKMNDSKGKQRLDSEEDVVDNFHSTVVDVLDQILERADMALDELSGKNKPPAIPLIVQPEKRPKVQSVGRRLDSTLVHASHVSKPQLLFRVPVDNRNVNVPWKPQLKNKPNAIIPLNESISSDPPSSSRHPYSFEIWNFQPPAHLLGPPSVPLRPEPLESSPPLIYISRAHQLPTLLQALSQASEIAVDLEHHSYRSFSGFLCLMQISTRTQDWVIDCLDPDIRQELECLNEVFTNPNIVKVFHGADSDIVWLQQNFNLYVVNMFDTYHATKVLDFPKHSLAALLEMYCDFTADKRYQLADWRIRPLPSEMLDYARSDTHFLLYIYDNLRNALVSPRTPPPQQEPLKAASPLLEVIRRSSETALKVYVKEIYDAEGGTGPGGWEILCRKWNKSVGLGDDVHSEVFKSVHAWRDKMARKEDESTRYVLPNHHLFRLAERPPSDLPGLLSVFHPVPPLVRAKSLELLDIIKNAVERSASKRNVLSTDSAVVIHDEDNNDKVRVIGSPEDATTGVWDTLKNISTAAPSSALFGSPVTPRDYSKSTSTFLGSSTISTVPPTSGPSEKNEKYINAIQRIHSALTLSAPLPPKSKIVQTANSVVTTATTTTTLTTTVPPATSSIEEVSTPDPAAVVEIPFVPPSQRPTIVQDPITNDNIVVVGRQQKRKRKHKIEDQDRVDADDNKESTEGSPTSTRKSKNQDSKASIEKGAIEPYDFSKEKNILDESASLQAALPAFGNKRKDRRKGNNHENHRAEKSSFGPAPRNRSEMKSGNMSGRF